MPVYQCGLPVRGPLYERHRCRAGNVIDRQDTRTFKDGERRPIAEELPVCAMPAINIPL